MNQDAIWDHFQNEGADLFVVARPRLEFLVRQLRRGERALNIGAGSGDLERLGTERGVEMWSLDPNARAVERLRTSLGLGERAQAGYSQEMPFPDAHFDAVVMSEVVEHLEPEILSRTLDELKRVLKPGGRFIGTVPANEDLDSQLVVCPSCAHQFHRWGHRTSFTVQSLSQLLETRFRVEKVEERFFNDWYGAGVKQRAAGLVKKFLSWAGMGPYRVARGLYFVARNA